VRHRLREIPRLIGYEKGPGWMSELRRRWVLLRHLHANVEIHPTCYLGPGFSLDIPHDGTFIAGPHCEFRRGFRAEVNGNGRIVFGAQSRCTYHVLMQCSTSIEIGERCMFGQSTIVLDGNHRFRDLSQPMLEQGYEFSPVVIEDDATITTKCTVMASVGRRAFIGANSVVTKPVPPFTVAVGAPAKPIDYFGPEGLEPEALTAGSS
jgi:acetyltransferase-like isoleucine patch superfamily enzyme